MIEFGDRTNVVLLKRVGQEQAGQKAEKEALCWHYQEKKMRA